MTRVRDGKGRSPPLAEDLRSPGLADVPEAKAVRLPRQRNAREELVAAVSHEIRAPLANAMLYLGILERELEAGRPNRQARSALAVARQEIARVERLVSRVTEMHRSGRPVLRPRWVDLGHVVHQSVERALPGAAAATVQVDLGSADLTGWWDETAVEQIVENLLSNALKYGEGRPIEVTVGRSGALVQLAVRDRGVGIPPGAQANLFRGRGGSPVQRSPGVGLGLWFVRALAEAHGGEASVRSRVGDGATFTVTLRPLDP